MQKLNKYSMSQWILILNLMIMLFPPIHLFFVGGSMPLALAFIFGSGAILTLSMAILRAIDHNTVEE